MKLLNFRIMILCCMMIAFGCTSAVTQTAPVPETEANPIQFKVIDMPKAASNSLTTAPDGSLYLIYGKDHSLYVSRSTDGGQTFHDPILATGDASVHVLPIEHPAIATGQSGQVGVAWLEMPADFNGANIWYSVSEDHGQTFKPGQLVASESEGEVAMVQASLDNAGNPILVWLNDSKLRFSRSFDGGITFSEVISIGDGSCECCQPQSVVIDDNMYITYRSLEPGNDKGDIRDIVMIRSTDKGETFQPVTRISDQHWYLPACPIAGPSLAIHRGNFYVAWMDGRAEPPGTFTRGDIWLASSVDAGTTFSKNIRINAEQSMHHTLPSIAVGPGGRIHVTWEAQTQGSGEAFLYYAFSDDQGQTFSQPQALADNTDSSRGNPGKPVIVADPMGQITLAWLDRLGVRIASWIDTR